MWTHFNHTANTVITIANDKNLAPTPVTGMMAPAVGAIGGGALNLALPGTGVGNAAAAGIKIIVKQGKRILPLDIRYIK